MGFAALYPSYNHPSPDFVNRWRGRVPAGFLGVLRMDTMAMVSSMLAMQSANTQQQIQTSIVKQNADAEKAAVPTLLGTANLAPGVGGTLNIAA